MSVTTKELARGLILERLFAGLCGRRGAFFLDSARSGGGLGRWSFIGFEPFLEFRETEAEGVTIMEGGQTTCRRGGDPLAALRECLRRYAAPGHGEIPFCGGAVGYLSYELCAVLERIGHRSADDLGLPRMLLGFHDGVLAHDHATGRTYAVANPVHERTAETILADLERAVAEAAGCSVPAETVRGGADPVSNFARAEYLERVRRVREYIAAGDVYQINLTQRFEAPYAGDPYALYRRLRAASPAAMAAYLNCGDFQVLSASPELLLRLDGREVETRPIKGTRPRGATPAEDERLRAELLASEKDRAELLMIVDLSRNDLGRVCETGSVRVVTNSAGWRRCRRVTILWRRCAAGSGRTATRSTPCARRSRAGRSPARRRFGRCRSSTSWRRCVAMSTPARSAGSASTATATSTSRSARCSAAPGRPITMWAVSGVGLGA
jgi:para-aminobenzoate synthetase component 1